ncbi:tetratricopeptide repeat protein [Chlorobaculum sp. 24CR]|uniref:tetratricopeptide repeat protein n=1 Tax=Chlorobaculum sp. 24CR TaxID=2508878 RepID=UPI001FD6B4A5|nr:tetratricopeptide repeat protein [Chlorobaculum sp. 24CR]
MTQSPKPYRRLAVLCRPFIILLCLAGLSACNNKEARIKELQQTVWKNPEDARGYLNLGKEYARQERYDDAIQAYRRAIDIEPGLDEAYSALGAAFFDKKEFTSALPWMQKRVAIAPDDSLRQFDLGNVYFQLSRYGDAIASYQTAIDNSYSFPEARYSMAVCYIKMGKIDEARKIHKWLQTKNNYLAVSLERHLQNDVPDKAGK